MAPRSATAKARSPAPRWQRRAEARPEEILEAALAEFDERGFEAARMEDIAKAAGISKAAIYLYFPSKMALLEALIEAKVAPLAAQAQKLAAAGQADPLNALKLFATVAAARMADPKVIAVPRLVIGISGRFPEIAEYYRTHVVAKARGALEQLIEAGIASGAIRKVDTAAVVRAFIGPLFFEAMWTHVLKGETALHDPQKLIEQQFDVLLHGLEPRA
ncbi:TetR/AcrR family transcriptional regulator [Terricaulis sp.]|uniref:TetR/AcrR family transcriptional regulator n=1 Tax=Terricaulis sp. TaxID=2768686 RepID=UPI002AC39E03|nr:TetR/AcrR family transcriptional regulator [Terricaulis sp.]MDZ4692080.1 TetR/AcrR family transcriptional regulator [Terricaulis sp.]